MGRGLTETDWAASATGAPTRVFTYNDAGCMTTAADPIIDELAQPASYEYDTYGNRVARTSYREEDGDPYTQTWEYDRADRLLTATDAGTQETSPRCGSSCATWWNQARTTWRSQPA